MRPAMGVQCPSPPSGRHSGCTALTPPTLPLAARSAAHRDARWGRMAEVFGEDPLLLSRMAAAYVRGLQGPPDAPYVKVGATCKVGGRAVLRLWQGCKVALRSQRERAGAGVCSCLLRCNP